MNYAEKMEMESRLLSNLADWIVEHGDVFSDRERSNEYCGVRIIEAKWRGFKFMIQIVDGITCRIDKE